MVVFVMGCGGMLVFEYYGGFGCDGVGEVECEEYYGKVEGRVVVEVVGCEVVEGGMVYCVFFMFGVG